jgi:DcuC family C4-dicarboxylate transporter
LSPLACANVLLVFWWLDLLRVRRDCQSPGIAAPGDRPEEDGPNEPAVSFRVNVAKAVVPVIPLALLLGAPRFLQLPRELSALTGPATILAAMLIGVAAAGLTTPRQVGQLPEAFFEGAGFAYTNVISLIITATLVIGGIEANGLIEKMTACLARSPALVMPVGVAIPWALAILSGSGIAPAVATIKALVPAAVALQLDPVRLGALSALAAHFGRTMSPAAAVVMLCATLSETTRGQLIERVAPPLLVGGGAVLLLAILFG